MNAQHDGQRQMPTGSILKKSTWTTPIDRRRGLSLAFSAMAMVMAFVGMSELSNADRQAYRESRIDPQRRRGTTTREGHCGARVERPRWSYVVSDCPSRRPLGSPSAVVAFNNRQGGPHC